VQQLQIISRQEVLPLTPSLAITDPGKKEHYLSEASRHFIKMIELLGGNATAGNHRLAAMASYELGLLITADPLKKEQCCGGSIPAL